MVDRLNAHNFSHSGGSLTTHSQTQHLFHKQLQPKAKAELSRELWYEHMDNYPL